MNTNKRMFRFLSYGMFKGIGVLWLVMFLVNTLSFIGTRSIITRSTQNMTIGPMIINEGSISFAASNMFALFIFFIVYGLATYYESFSLAIGFGGTRKNFYLNVIVNNIMVALIFGVIQIILLKIDNYLVSTIGYEPMVEFGLFNIKEDNLIYSILSLSLIFLASVSITNLIGVLQYRFSYKFWISLGIFALVTKRISNFINFSQNPTYIRLTQSIMDMAEGANAVFLNQVIFTVNFIIIILAYLIGFLVIRKANIK